jgi:hypothetical protein
MLSNSTSEKKRETFFGFLKISPFLPCKWIKIIMNFSRNRSAGNKAIVFLKEQVTGYLPMHLSQFGRF